MQTRRGWWLPGAACLLLGLAGGLVIERTRARAEVKTPAAAPSSTSGPVEAAGGAGPASTLPVSAKLDDGDKEALRLLIRKELQGMRPQPSQPTPVASAAPAATTHPDAQTVPPVLSEEQEVAYERARTVVDDGIARGSWTEDDRTQLRQSMKGLPFEARDQVMRSIVVAANQGRVQPQVRGPLF